MKTSKKYVCLIFISLVLLLILLLFFINHLNKFKMQPDSDNTFYVSENSNLTFSDNSLSVFDKEKKDTIIYTEEGEEHKDTFTVKYREYEISVVENGLSINADDLNEYIIDGDTSDFTISGDHVIYRSNAQTISLYNVKSDNSHQIKIDSDNNIRWFDANEEEIFIASRHYDDSVGNVYNIEVYNIETLKIVKSMIYNITENTKFFLCDDNVFAVSPPDESVVIYGVNFSTQKFEKLYTHTNVNCITASDNYIVFSSEEYSTSELITHTIENKDNGLWKYNVSNGKITKISDECVFSDLVATDNYVYGYTKEYYLPRGLINSWVKGYKISQIPIC